MDKPKKVFGTLPKQPLGSFSHVVAYWSSLKNTEKMNFQLSLNKKSLGAHMELEFDMLCVVENMWFACSKK
jgi:hypothetical protein